MVNLVGRKSPVPWRVINIVNFIRAVEPRGPVDLFEPVQRQMELIKRQGLPATWLLQYDAMVRGPFVEFLKKNMPDTHEVGLWFEMNEEHCNAADVMWRGRPGYEWDWNPSVAFSIGYTPEERIRLVDASAKKFRELWGQYPRSVASWNLDSITVQHFVDKYKVKAFAVCRDQIATDGFTIWGAPIAGYFPSKLNCWSPALDPANQIDAPVFRMLGQDPVYYYDKTYKGPGGEMTDEPDTMEPAWVAGRSPRFVDRFLKMISQNPCGQFAYVQLGQENSFGWQAMEQGYEMQMEKLVGLVSKQAVTVTTMGDAGEAFSRRFRLTPAQAQVQLDDPFDQGRRSIWYQSRFYRGNLHFNYDLPFFRDLTVYSDRFRQPFLARPTRAQSVDQRLLAILDEYHWKIADGGVGGGYLRIGKSGVLLDSPPQVSEFHSTLSTLNVHMAVRPKALLSVSFHPDRLELYGDTEFSLCFEWDTAKSSFRTLAGNAAMYERDGFGYSVKVEQGRGEQTALGWTAHSYDRRILLTMGQT